MCAKILLTVKKRRKVKKVSEIWALYGTITVFECILTRMPRCRVSDAQEELEVARARGELSRLMRQNDTLEQELEEMDKKIGLLVQNRISVQDVIADRKKGRDLASY
jgi:hypothetical protein